MTKTIIPVFITGFMAAVFCGAAAAGLGTGYGWFVDGTEKKAVEKSVSMMAGGVSSPGLVILYSTVGYDTALVLKELRKQIGDKPAIFGMTSCWGVVSPDGVHAGEKASLAILGITSDTSSFGVGGASTAAINNIETAVASEVKHAIARAGKPDGATPDMILMASSPGIEEKVLKGIADVVGKEVPVYGGSAADNTLEGHWKVFSNDNVYSSGFSVAVIYTDHKIGHAYHSGYLGSSKSGVVTKVKNGVSRELLEIDNQPAAQVYNEWAYEKFGDQLEKGGSILGPASFYPLAKKVQADGCSHFIGVHPSFMKKDTKSMDLFANVETGCRLYFTEGTPDALIYRPFTVTRRALVSGRIKKADAGAGVFIYCGGTMLAVQDRIKEIVPIINKSLGRTPYIGAFTFGEQGNIKGYGNFHGNLMSSMVIMGKN